MGRDIKTSSISRNDLIALCWFGRRIENPSLWDARVITPHRRRKVNKPGGGGGGRKSKTAWGVRPNTNGGGGGGAGGGGCRGSPHSLLDGSFTTAFPPGTLVYLRPRHLPLASKGVWSAVSSLIGVWGGAPEAFTLYALNPAKN